MHNGYIASQSYQGYGLCLILLFCHFLHMTLDSWHNIAASDPDIMCIFQEWRGSKGQVPADFLEEHMLVKGRKKKSVNPGSPGEQHPPPPAIHSHLFLGPGWEPGRVLLVGSAKGYSRSASKRKGPKASVSVSSPPSSSGHFSPNLLVSHSSFFCLAFPFRF